MVKPLAAAGYGFERPRCAVELIVISTGYGRSCSDGDDEDEDGKGSEEGDEDEVTAATPVVDEIVNMGILTLTKLSMRTTRILITVKMPAARKTGTMR